MSNVESHDDRIDVMVGEDDEIPGIAERVLEEQIILSSRLANELRVLKNSFVDLKYTDAQMRAAQSISDAMAWLSVNVRHWENRRQ